MPENEGMEHQKVIYDAQRTRRVIIYAHSNGTFGFMEERWSDYPLEQTWLPGRSLTSCCDSVESAVREAKERIEWFGEQEKTRGSD